MAEDPLDRAVIAEAFAEARSRSRWLLEQIPRHLLDKQILPFLSPPYWDLNHVANVEEKWISCDQGENAPVNEQFMDTFDMMLHPRTERGNLELPDFQGTFDYWDAVTKRTLQCLEKADFTNPADPLTYNAYVYWFVINHEAQHQETVMQSMDRYHGEYVPTNIRAHPEAPGSSPHMLDLDGGSFEMGLDVGSGIWGSHYDCEAPKHQTHVDAFEIGKYPVTNGEWLRFLEAGGYEELELWDDKGQRWLRDETHHAPLDWYQVDGIWHRRTLLSAERIADVGDEILTHVCHHEAKAFAKWSDARLPTEMEWEYAARYDPESGRSLRNPWGNSFADPGVQANCDIMGWGPSRIGSFDDHASPLGMSHACGDVWEWSGDQFHGYPGFEPFPYEDYSQTWYNIGQYTLRGGSWASRTTCATSTFRNWDLPQRRQIHVGLRLARDA